MITTLKWLATAFALFAAWMLFDEHELAVMERFDRLDDTLASFGTGSEGRWN